MISVNPNTGEEHDIPNSIDDHAAIDAFILQNEGKKVVVVQGLGFVGAVMSIVVANALEEEYAVVGIDLPSSNSYWKILSINKGEFPVISSDNKVEEFYQKSRNKKNFIATCDPYVYSRADIVIVDIGLDVQKHSDTNRKLEHYEVDLSSFEKAIRSIAENGKDGLLVLVETTVPPGTCQKIAAPIFEEVYKTRGLTNYYVGHSYERVMPGPGYIDSIQNFYRVYSGINEESAERTRLFLETVISTDKYPLTRLGNTNATEMAKVMENSFRAMNIAFVGEWTEFAEEAGVNLFEVVDAIRMRPTHKNIMAPGLGVGGYCLTKDPLLASWSRQEFFDGKSPLLQSEAAVQINDQMPLHCVELVEKFFADGLSGKKILLLGISYLVNVGDTRFTPVELLYDKLKSGGCEMFLHDPFVSIWEEKDLVVPNHYNDVDFGGLDAVIICTGHDLYKSDHNLHEQIQHEMNPGLIVDAGRLFDDDLLNKFKEKHTVKMLGRGDIN